MVVCRTTSALARRRRSCSRSPPPLLPDARRRGLQGIAVLGVGQIALILALAPTLPPLPIVLGTVRSLRRSRGALAPGPAATLSREAASRHMSVLRTIESKIEGLFEGVFGRAFRTHVQPVELARKLAKEMDEHRSVSVSRVYVPNEYTIYLSSADRQQFASYEGSLVGELQEYLTEHARREAYALLTPPRVKFATDDDLAVGEFGIATRVAQPGGRRCRRCPRRPQPRRRGASRSRPAPVAAAPVAVPTPPPAPASNRPRRRR